MSAGGTENRQKILIADDEHLNRRTLADSLRHDYTVILAKNGHQALERTRVHAPDLILLDIVMPGQSGYDVLRQLKDNSTTKDIPVIFISALDSEQEEEKGLLLGATDYISKPFRQSLVKARIANHMQMVRQRKLLEVLVNLDGLTNIANRRCFEETLQTEWARARRSRLPISVAMVDVDHFKEYNDHYGHGEGDKALRQVADTLSNSLKRPSDQVARYGGEEFVVLMPDTDSDGALSLMEHLRQTVENLAIAHSPSPTQDVLTISIGGATVLPDGQETPGELLHQADAALYRAKSQGRNRVIWD